ncbi:MAG: peptidoglycan DD-metalloendopeptidase family protein [Muribaculaceae bacterium]|nr:peptidoglycan DD-metalloendopeptidase family protein [Muribaculaceae bacterium]
MRNAKLSAILLTATLALTLPVEARQKTVRTSSTIKKEQKATLQEINKTSQKLDEVGKRAERSLNRLNSLRAEIKLQERDIKDMKRQVDSINRAMRKLNDSISTLDQRIGAMRDKYSTALRKMQTTQGDMSKFGFIFSSESFYQAYRRMRYLQQFSHWRRLKAEEIKEMQHDLETQRDRLATLQKDKNAKLATMSRARDILAKQQKETSSLISKLKKEKTSLQQVLKKKRKQAQDLDNELEKLIAEERHKQEEAERKAREAEERRKAELAKTDTDTSKQISDKDSSKQVKTDEKTTPKKDKEIALTSAEDTRKLTGSFESNKGQLLFPVSGKYKIVRPFGRNTHPELPYVQIENGGIDIEVTQGSTARAIFTGKVSAIFRQPGYNNIVMIRHGSYLTIYANIGTIAVKTGDYVVPGQNIGTIFADPDDDNRSILHFEIRKETQKLNPTSWVK